MNLYQFNADQMKRIQFILENICKESKDRQERFKEAIQSYLDIFFISILRDNILPKSISNNPNDYMLERLEEFQELISLSATQFKQVSYYAEQLNLTNYQLNAITKTTLNKTCSELIIDHLLLEAKRYLLATAKQVNQIASQLGYEDVSYFVRFFKSIPDFHLKHSEKALNNS